MYSTCNSPATAFQEELGSLNIKCQQSLTRIRSVSRIKIIFELSGLFHFHKNFNNKALLLCVSFTKKVITTQ